jgi:tetratricopeptide (TPR) repeat protein
VRGPLLQAAELAGGAVEVNLLRPATFERLRAVLAYGDGYDILHFDGHGYAEAGAAGTSGVVFEDEKGRAWPVSADEFANSVLAARIPLIVLNACRSAYHEASADGGTMGGSVAAALLNAGAGSVLAMTHNVAAPVVATFMTAFYDALVAGDTVATAVSYGRWALLVKQADEEADRPFHLIPVLYEQHAVELRAPVGSPPRSPAVPHHPEPVSVQSLMHLDEELAEIDRQLHDGSPVVVHGPVVSGKSVLLRAYARYALLTRGFDHVEFITDEQLATDESLLLHRVRDNARAFAGRPVLHVWDGVDQYLDSCAEATRALPAEHRVLMSARYDSFTLPHYDHATRIVPGEVLDELLGQAHQDEIAENPDFTRDEPLSIWLIRSSGWHGATLSAILRARRSIPLYHIPRRLDLDYPEGEADPFLDPSVRQCLADLPPALLEALSYLGLYGSQILPVMLTSLTEGHVADDLFGTVTGTHISLDRWTELLDQAHRAGVLSPRLASKAGYWMSPLVGYALRGELVRRFSPEQLRRLQRGANISVAFTLQHVFAGVPEGPIYALQQTLHVVSTYLETTVWVALLRAIDLADYDVAEAIIDACVEGLPVDSPAWQNSVRLLRQVYELCHEQLESDPDCRPLTLALHLAMGKAAAARSDWGQAMTHLERLLAHPDESLVRENMLPLLLWRVDIALELSDPDRVQTALADAVRQARAEADEDALDQCRTTLQEFITRLDLLPHAAGELAREVGLPDPATAVQPAGIDDEAIVDTLLRQLREAELGGRLSDAARLRRHLGMAVRNAGDSEGGRRWLTSAIELERSSSGIGDLAATAHQLAILEEKADNLDDAASWCRVVLEFPSASALQKAHAHHQLGVIEFKGNRDDAAIRALDAAAGHYHALGMHTSVAEVDTLAAHALHRKGDLAGATELSDSVVRTLMEHGSDEHAIKALVSLADIMLNGGDEQAATAHFLRLLPDSGERSLAFAEKFVQHMTELLQSKQEPDRDEWSNRVAAGCARCSVLVLAGGGILRNGDADQGVWCRTCDDIETQTEADDFEDDDLVLPAARPRGCVSSISLKVLGLTVACFRCGQGTVCVAGLYPERPSPTYVGLHTVTDDRTMALAQRLLQQHGQSNLAGLIQLRYSKIMGERSLANCCQHCGVFQDSFIISEEAVSCIVGGSLDGLDTLAIADCPVLDWQRIVHVSSSAICV